MTNRVTSAVGEAADVRGAAGAGGEASGGAVSAGPDWDATTGHRWQ
ncbi:hypothetical protein [Micromonospora musae]|nr:hypothetical protein [Micromonospora musae]